MPVRRRALRKLCQYPNKEKLNKLTAESVVRRYRRRGLFLRAYKCGDHYHATHLRSKNG